MYDIGKTVYENYREYPNTWRGRSTIDVAIFGLGTVVGGLIVVEGMVAGVAGDLFGDAIKKCLYKD